MNGTSCKTAMRDLTRRDRLDAVARGRLELHLRACDECREAAAGLEAMESAQLQLEPIGEEQVRAIYDRLIPAVHEIAVELRPENQKRWRPSWALNFGLAAGAAVIAAVIIGVVKFGGEPAAPLEAPAPVVAAMSADVELVGSLDRSEGTVLVDSVAATDFEGGFKVRRGTEIAVEDGSTINFRIGNEARVALVGNTRWRISAATETLIEMELDMGRMAVEFDGTRGRMMDIRTPDSIVRVRGTVFTVEVVPTGGTHVSVIEGRVDVISLGTPGQMIELSEEEMIAMPGDGIIDEPGDEQRALAAEVNALDETFVASAGRLVHFDGNPERARVEVDGRFIGYTPLAVRLWEGPLSYRLSAPGMEPMEGTLVNEQIGEEVGFQLAPAPYPEVPAEIAEASRAKSAQPKTTPRVRWGLVERAHAAMTAGDIPFAVDLLERLAEKTSGDRLVSALSLLAECYSSMGRYGEAAETYDRVASLVPGTKVAQNARYEIGRLAMDRLGDYGRARAAFTAYLASAKDGELKESAYYSLCKVNGRDGAHQEALHCFNEFLRTYPGGYYEPNARLWRGALYQDVLKRWADAERDLLAFIAAKPRHPRCEEARYRIAIGRYQVGDLRGTLRAIDEHLREHPGGQYTVRAKRLRGAILDPDFSSGAE